MAYSSTTDYAGLIAARKKQGYGDDDPQIQAWNNARAEKGADLTDAERKKNGFANTYDINTGKGYDENGMAYQKVIYEKDPNNPGVYNVTNVSTGATVGDPVYWSNPTTNNDNPSNTQQPYQSPKPRYDYTNDINNQYKSLTEATKAKLRANLQQQLSKFGGLKDRANQQAIGSLNANDATMLQNLQRLYNANEAQGQYGGSGANISGQVQLGAIQGQNANAIRQDRDNYLNDLDTQANTLQSTAADNELAMTNELETQRLKDLQRAHEYMDNLDMQERQFQYGIDKDTQDRLDQLQRLNDANSQWQQSFDADQKWKQYEADQAQRETQWAKSNDNPAVKAQILANQIAQLELQNLPEQQRLEIQRMKSQIAQIGAVKPKSDYEVQMQRVALETAKEKLNQLKNTSNTPKVVDTSKNEKKSQLMRLKDSMTSAQWNDYKQTRKYDIIGTFGQNFYDNLY